MTTTASTAKAGKYLTFKIANESYGIEVLKVREIIKVQPITRVPEMPSFIKGVINLRGKIIPIIDLRSKLGLEETAFTDNTCIIVVNFKENSTLIGLIVDAVEEVSNIAENEIEPTPRFVSDQNVTCIRGMAKLKGSVKTLLDVDEVIGGDPAALLAQIAPSAKV